MNLLEDVVRIISFIRDAGAGCNEIHQLFGYRRFMLLSRGNPQLKRPSVDIYGRMNFGGAPPTRASYGVFFAPPTPPLES